MPLNLTSGVTLPNIMRLVAQKPFIDDDNNFMSVPIQIRTNAGSDLFITTKTLNITNGKTDQMIRNPTPTPGTAVTDLILVIPGNILTPTGFTDALAAWVGGGASATSKRNALENALKAMGAVDQVTLAAT